MKERVEDLGKLSVMIDQLLEMHGEFEEIYFGRNKDFIDWFGEQDDEKSETVLRKLIYDREILKEKLYKMSEIADGRDNFNAPGSL